ncbi:hypothetical protein AB0E08_30795 [Streptomyces sp. NPDC048281]|uniref:hypothetical protein n=1 Tax=Streptomyces sp. NPDC048281 TaxID=3154715 RepID=UPI003426D6A3
MAAVDREWWGVWGWPWALLWVLTVLGWAVLAGYGGTAFVRRRRGRGGGRTVHGMCFYLHEQRVMDLFQSGGFAAALEQEVADRTNVTTGFGLKGRLGLGDGSATQDITRERVTKYVRQNTPITVIRLLMDTMRKEDVIVDADLLTDRIVPNRALGERLRERHAERVALSDVMPEFVWVTGRFTARRLGDRTLVLRAGYGTAPDETAHVRMACAVSGVREEFRDEEYPDGVEFQARCLGKVRSWNRQARELTLDPLAVFR